jgi:transcription initiation factor TFIIIB Brf1 subunit/transcription initiation factor TFIIB
MQQPAATGIVPPSRAQLSDPVLLLQWARSQFDAQIQAAQRSPQEAVQGIKDILQGLGLPPRVIVRCRVSGDALIDVAFEWQSFEARQQHDEDGGAQWYLFMPARALEPLPPSIPQQEPA